MNTAHQIMTVTEAMQKLDVASFSVDKPQPTHSENNENNKLPIL